MFKGAYFYGLGRRKSATARSRLYAKGKGVIMINDKKAEEYLDGNATLRHELVAPLALIGKTDDYDISLLVSGGGLC